MTLISELFSDAKFMLRYRTETMKVQKALDREAPKVGDIAPDFTLRDVSGKKAVTLSDFRGDRPVVLVFGSFT